MTVSKLQTISFFIVVLVCMGVFTGCPPSSISVPDVVGLTQSAAETAIVAANLTVGQISDAFSDTVPIGQVISQNPPAGASVAASTAVSLTISAGPETRNIGIVIDSALEDNVSTSAQLYAVSGQVIVLDQGPLPGSIAWNQTTAAIKANGTAPVAQDGTWTANVPLEAGDNFIEFSVERSPETELLQVTYNPNYTLSGQLILWPDIAYVNEPREFTALVALTDPRTDPADVVLYRVDGTQETIAQMADDGGLANGDEIQGDGIYSARFVLTGTEVSTAEFRVAVGLNDSEDAAFSEVFPVTIAEHITESEFNAAISSQVEYQSQLNTSIGKDAADIRQTVDEILAQLKNDPGVEDAGESASGLGLWVIYAGGIPGVIYAPLADTLSGGMRSVDMPAAEEPSDRFVAYEPYRHYYDSILPASKGTSDNEIESSKALTINLVNHQFGDAGFAAKIQLLEDHCFTVDSIASSADGTSSVESFKNLGDYGVILIMTHGDSFYNGLLNFWQDSFGWNGIFGEVVMYSNMKVTTANRVTYEDDLRTGRLVVWGDTYGMLPGFFRQYSGKLPNSFVWIAICRGAWNASLANAFLSRGAGAVFAYDDYVYVSFARDTGFTLLENMVKPDATVNTAFTPGQTDAGPDFAVFKHFGSKTLAFGDLSELKDGGFESNSLSQAWTTAGDARIIPQLGSAAPTEGSFMGIISTGLGFTTSSGSIVQELCMPATAQKLLFNWNFYSHEYLTYVGTQFQDSFAVTMTDTEDTSNTATLLARTVDDLAGQVSPVAITLDPSEAASSATTGIEDDGCFATGWQSFEVNVPPALLDKRVALSFYITDVGDSIFDSALLLDNIRIMEVTP